MSFETFENKADIGVRGKGSTVSVAFEECAKAMMSVMVDVNLIEPKKSHVINIKAADMGALLIAFLNELLFIKDKKKMIYSKFRVNIAENKNDFGEEEFELKATLFGEKIDSKKHQFKVDVKAPTYSELKVEANKGIWTAQCVVDV
jgi:SHS2 domain-containing protein